MSTPYTVRSLSRGLSLLAALNARCHASLAELARDTGLPKPTTFRLLQTLLDDEFVARDPETDNYRLAARVCSLSSGFEEDAWLVEHTQEHLDRLGADLVWPISVTTLAGLRVMVRSNTDSTSPLAVRRLMPGMTLPILDSASGQVLLAFSSDEGRKQLLDSLKASHEPADLPARNERRINKILTGIQHRGYATKAVTMRVSILKTLAVPIMVGERGVAALVIRFSDKAVAAKDVHDRFLPALQVTAAAIGRDIEQDPRASRVFVG